jgi:hypothetical protein
MNPVRYEGPQAVFYTWQLYCHGWPEEFGFTNYLVVDDGEFDGYSNYASQQESPASPEPSNPPDPFVFDYKDETNQGGREKLRPMHKYNRQERFTTTLAQLLGLKDPIENEKWPNIKSLKSILKIVEDTLAGNIIGSPIDEIPYKIKRKDILATIRPHVNWENIRQVLKTTGNRKYYNFIPSIMRLMGKDPITFGPKKKITYSLFHKMVEDFVEFQRAYMVIERERIDELVRQQLPITKKYFPSLRYIAFKIMQDNDADFNDVVFIRTLRIEKKLEGVWENIMFIDYIGNITAPNVLLFAEFPVAQV